jgi:hypothetical protein
MMNIKSMQRRILEDAIKLKKLKRSLGMMVWLFAFQNCFL